MFLALIRQCYRSSPVAREETSSSAAIDPHARVTATIYRSVYLHAPSCPERRRIDGTRRWRPALSAILENASTGECGRRRSNNVSFRKSVTRETTSVSRRDPALKRAWKNTVTYQIASPGFAPSPFMY